MGRDETLVQPERLAALRASIDAKLERRRRAREILARKPKPPWWKRWLGIA